MSAGIGRRGATAADEPLRLSATSVAWRLIVVVVCLVVLIFAQLTDTDDFFPLSRLSQYAYAPGHDGIVKSTYILADTTEGEQVRVPLNSEGVGIGRAEVEGQLSRIIDDPSLLQAIANAWAELHPDQPQYEALYLMRDFYELADGKPSGNRETVELAYWEVQ
ncbi:MAG TPA: hypothetical protein VFR23_08240 [Jiangellaceae bacterium]|nr:hypothetical protein [Jiangellaceae bacterium]